MIESEKKKEWKKQNKTKRAHGTNIHSKGIPEEEKESVSLFEEIIAYKLPKSEERNRHIDSRILKNSN